MSHPVRRIALGLVAAAVTLLGCVAPAAAHGFTSTVYVDVTAGDAGHIRTKLELEYDLYVVSAADTEKNDALFQAGTAAFEAHNGEAQAAALERYADPAVAYVTERFAVTAEGAPCSPVRSGGFTIGGREGVPYATLLLDWTCPEAAEHEVRSGLFPDAETFVKDTKTIVTYELGGISGSAALDAANPSFSTALPWYERFYEFFLLGAEHLLFGLDHVLFLLALIAGSRRLREVVLVATSFTLAHSVTFLLAALGLVSVPASVVEPVIALSIAVVAAWHLWQLRRPVALGDHLDRSGAARLGVVFLFGLVHGLGFAGALGIQEAWSWTLLWSLLVFNVGIEAVQLGLIVLIFPALSLLRRRSPAAGRWATGLVAAAVAVMGLIWFVERTFWNSP
ncbi:HupE/UreJ family protein [Herbidospora galbida]|uniref:HupE/UreJ family protein n=1 Tax=Herbidospora galbida TaxID=2575442 RepID=A0A4U3MN16_9ACTN|nr:HupE/UreJ family protein [Herbidospora galbida]TKK89567.1 HupE/UreJ family protein [Herbidospora galbida]